MDNALKQLMKIFEDVPDNEKAREIFDSLFVLVENGSIVAFRNDEGEVIYRSFIHCTREDLSRAISLKELNDSQEELIRQIQSQYN